MNIHNPVSQDIRKLWKCSILETPVNLNGPSVWVNHGWECRLYTCQEYSRWQHPCKPQNVIDTQADCSQGMCTNLIMEGLVEGESVFGNVALSKKRRISPNSICKQNLFFFELWGASHGADLDWS